MTSLFGITDRLMVRVGDGQHCHSRCHVVHMSAGNGGSGCAGDMEPPNSTMVISAEDSFAGNE